MTKEELIKFSTETFGADKYSFDKTEIKRMKDKVTITCSKHGDFEKPLTSFVYKKVGCPLCSKHIYHTTESFIQKCIEKRGIEDDIDYSKVVFTRRDDKITVICKKHGDFKISAGHFLDGEGCPKCRYEKVANKTKSNINVLLQKANAIHNDKYDYSLITPQVYKNYKTLLPIICHEQDENGNEHGVFYQSIGNHTHLTNPQGCPKCGQIKCGKTRRMTFEEIVRRAKITHQNKYEYVNDNNYETTESYLHIICPEHGDFYQVAGNHLYGQGCPKCFAAKSKIEQEVLDFVKEIYQGEIIENDRKALGGFEIDIFAPEKQVGIEVDGLIWHSERFEQNNSALLDKTNLGEYKGIQIIHIYEDEWNNKQDICKSRIRSLLQLSQNRIYARKCQIIDVDSKTATQFLDENHLQGKVGSYFRYGLQYNNELVALMTFGNTRHFIGNSQHQYELLRFCNKLNTNVIGGASKLFKHFIRTYRPNNIVSYADRRWSVGNLYYILGFELYNISRPNYFYVIGYERKNRFNFRKRILVDKYNCPADKSEREFCKEQGWYRIYDCGCYCFEWKKRW